MEPCLREARATRPRRTPGLHVAPPTDPESRALPGAGVTTDFHLSHRDKQPSYLPQKCSPTCSEEKPVLKVLGARGNDEQSV